MTVIDNSDLMTIGDVPETLIQALTVLAEGLHQFYKPMIGEQSKGSCVLSSLTTREFLFKAGFRDVEVRVVKTIMHAYKEGKELHSAGLGFATPEQRPDRWAGHMVVIIPSLNYLIDTTLFPMKRPAWDFLKGMVATPIRRQPDKKIFNLPFLTGFEVSIPDDKYQFELVWLDDPDNNTWKKAPDALRKRRRDVIVDAMMKRLKSAI